MSIKTLFDKQKQAILPSKTMESKSAQDFATEVESSEYITQYQNSIDLYLQDVNFATASNFARFGSARKYYENIIDRVTNYFPYDGSKASQLEFQNNLNPFEKYIYLYEYPRTTGYITLDNTSTNQYVRFFNTSQDNVYDPDNGLRENVRFDFLSGSTIEFWMKKNSFKNSYEHVAQFYGNATATTINNKYLYVYTRSALNHSSSINIAYYSGSTTNFIHEISTGLTTVADSNWHHYAITLFSSSAGYTTELYVDGKYCSSQSTAGTIDNLTGSIVGYIGSSNNATSLTASIDEFRFWNTKRDAKQIGLNYFTNVGGGNNVANTTNLGIYYKFNEGIIGDSNSDSIILDYAGRNCNGLFTGYASSSRNTGSAITVTQDKPEIETPILYKINPSIQTFLDEKLLLADEYDYTNNFALKNSMPAWILDEDSNNGDTLTNFLQTLASYLDTLYLQISTYKNIKNKEYLNYKGKAPPFSDLMLTSNGFDLPSLFLNTDIVQSLLNQDSKRTYDESLNNLKNVIYKNIYNNLNIINKSKGTENSIKQLIKSFGVNEEVFSLNIYADNTTYSYEDTYVNKSLKKDFVDFTPFSASANSSAVIYQDETDSGSKAFITGTSNTELSFTAECDVVIPEFPFSYSPLAYQTLTYNTSSIFGIRTAGNTAGDTTIPTDDPAGLKVRFIYRDDKGYFQLSYPSASVTLTSSVFDDVTTNQHWNLAIRLSPVLTGSSYNLEFSGYSNYVSDAFNSFSVSASIPSTSGSTILSNNKRLYLGAEKTNVTGATVYSSLFRGLSTRFWADRLSSSELEEHAKNPNNYGRENPSEPYTLATSSYIPKSETLLLHWDFTNVTSSDGSGNISNVYDLTSGSSTGNRYSVAPLQSFVGYSYNGKGTGFNPSSTVKGKQLIYSSEQQLPENLYSSQLVNILESDDNYYTNSIRPQKYFFSLENSMYDIISKNMLNMFSSIIEFNNFVGNPMNTYKSQYSRLKSFRRLFFEKVENQPDLDKYVGIYKWIDDALDSVLVNLLPASANASEKVRTIIENHILERDKIQFPRRPEKSVSSTGSKTGELGGKNGNITPPGSGLPPKSKPTRVRVGAAIKRGVYTTGPTIQPEGLGIESTEKILSPLIPNNPTDPSTYQRGVVAGRIGNRR